MRNYVNTPVSQKVKHRGSFVLNTLQIPGRDSVLKKQYYIAMRCGLGNFLMTTEDE